MRRPRWILLAVLACGSALAGPQDAPRVAPDPPKDSPRQAELANRVKALVDAFADSQPVMTRDGKRVVFISNRDGLPQVYIADMDRPEALPKRVVTTTERIDNPSPLPDGKSLIFRSDHGADENWSVFTCGLDGSGTWWPKTRAIRWLARKTRSSFSAAPPYSSRPS